MPRHTLPLNDTQLRNAKPKQKDYKLSDGFGLYIIIKTTGSKWWRFKYRFDNKEQNLSLGTYPEISLQIARQKREELRSKVANGINPSSERQQKKEIQKAKLDNTFEQVSEMWLVNIRKGLSNHYVKGVEGYFKNHIYKHIGNKDINEITRLELLEAIQEIDKKGYSETARRALNVCGSVWKYAVTIGRAEHNIVADIDKKYALAKTVKQHYPVITNPKELGALLRGIDGYHGSLIVRQALRLAVLVFLRPANIRFAEWCEIDFENKVWRIPAEKMKMKALHIVPLCKQALQILEELKPLTGSGKYLFPSPNTTLKPICENRRNEKNGRLKMSV